jgi:chromosome segregation ATPase
MSHLAVNLSLIEIGVLLCGAIVLGIAIYFYIISRRSLNQTIEKTKGKVTLRPEFYSTASATAAEPKVPKPAMPVSRPEVRKMILDEPEELPKAAAAPKSKAIHNEESIDSLKSTIQQQQKLLNSFLQQVEEVEKHGREELEMDNKHLKEEIKALEAQLDKKDAEVEEVRQQAKMAERMAARIDEVYQEFEQLQAKMVTLEKQANRANKLALELEDTRQAYEGVHRDLQRKTEKVEEIFMENQRLQQQLNSLEDKLAEANLQRQQLHKKVQFLQDLNTDLQSVSDTNKKLNTELRRIGELESMLTMIAEERDYLLKRGK